MGYISWHSNQSSYPTGMKKKTLYVEANALSMYMYAKFQLPSPYGFWEEDF